MKKVLPVLLCVLLFFGMFLGSLVVADLDSKVDEFPKPPLVQRTQDDYEPENVYYVVTNGLSGVPRYDDGSNPDLNNIDLGNGQTKDFPYPIPPKRPITFEYNQNFVGEPYLQLILNSYTRPDKVINAEIGIDTDGDKIFELVCTFPSYHTTGSNLDGTMEEEIYEAFGTWQGGNPPAVIYGRVILRLVMTSPNGEPCLLYCGFDYKISWLAFPYMHTDLEPHAKINQTLSAVGDKLMAGDVITVDGSDSWDPNDDQNGNGRIDDGYPDKEPMGETDRLKYKWSWGDGTFTDLDFTNRRISHVYSNDAIPPKSEFFIFQVNLTVMDLEGHMDFDTMDVKIYRGNHSPNIESLMINNVEHCCSCTPPLIKIVLAQSFRVKFSAHATDADGDPLTYHWDFNDDGKYEIEGDETKASNVVYGFIEPFFKPGNQKISLTISDGTLVENTTFSTLVNMVHNQAPVPVIDIQGVEFREITNNITVRTRQTIIFDSSLSYDPDNLPGYDLDNDYSPDINLLYRWNFDQFDPVASSGWTTKPTFEWRYLSPGDYKYIVTLQVDDGLAVSTSEPFEVNINVRPIAIISIDPASYDSHGNFQVGKPIYFNGTRSYDPNGDEILNYSWDFGDGNRSNEVSPTHVYTAASEYIVTLIVRDYDFASSPDSLNIDLPIQFDWTRLIRYTVEPLKVYTLSNVHFDASETSELVPGEIKLNFKWYFGDNITSREISTEHRYLTAGEYPISLEISDQSGNTITKSEFIVHIMNRKPVALLKRIKNAPANEIILVSGASSHDNDGYITKYMFNFGDGETSNWLNDSVTEHTYAHGGKYTLTLTVMDNLGATNETQVQINVIDTSTSTIDSVATFYLAGFLIIVIIIALIIVIRIFNRHRE